MNAVSIEMENPKGRESHLAAAEITLARGLLLGIGSAAFVNTLWRVAEAVLTGPMFSASGLLYAAGSLVVAGASAMGYRALSKHNTSRTNTCG